MYRCSLTFYCNENWRQQLSRMTKDPSSLSYKLVSPSFNIQKRNLFYVLPEHVVLFSETELYKLHWNFGHHTEAATFRTLDRAYPLGTTPDDNEDWKTYLITALLAKSTSACPNAIDLLHPMRSHSTSTFPLISCSSMENQPSMLFATTHTSTEQPSSC